MLIFRTHLLYLKFFFLSEQLSRIMEWQRYAKKLNKRQVTAVDSNVPTSCYQESNIRVPLVIPSLNCFLGQQGVGTLLLIMQLLVFIKFFSVPLPFNNPRNMFREKKKTSNKDD
ncbi:hypothetical protein ACOSQ3_021220 [Xanthoceras sorbifolium]